MASKFLLHGSIQSVPVKEYEYKGRPGADSGTVSSIEQNAGIDQYKGEEEDLIKVDGYKEGQAHRELAGETESDVRHFLVFPLYRLIKCKAGPMLDAY